MEKAPIGTSAETGGPPLVVTLDDVGAADVALVGGKGATLGELRRLHGTGVPDGWCITTEAFRRGVVADPAVAAAVGALAGPAADDPEDRARACSTARRAVESVTLPAQVVDAISEVVREAGDEASWAVRSSATVEDLPRASFAGLMESHLGVRGPDEVLRHVGLCWASSFTNRAVTELRRRGVDPRDVRTAVVVQRMVEDPIASGVVFTAHPVTSDRSTAVIEAVPGRGDALVAGRVAPESLEVRDGEVVDRATAERGDDAGSPVVSDRRAVELVGLCRRVEAHLGSPQDVEWCWDGSGPHLVQSRPITTLFPVPDTGDDVTHVYVSVGHQQMMTDPMRPLGLTMWGMVARAPMVAAGGRLFVDVTAALASPRTREGLVTTLGRGDPLLGDAVRAVVDRGLVPTVPDDGDGPAAPPGAGPSSPPTADPAIVDDLVARTRAAHEAAAAELRTLSGAEVTAFVRRDVERAQQEMLGHDVLAAVMASMDAAWWLEENLGRWLGETAAVHALSRAAPGNPTSRMGLELLDVADVLRPLPAVVAHLRTVPAGGPGDGFLRDLDPLPGGREARRALEGWLERHGMRGEGEIDITRPRWGEQPSTLLPVLLAHVDSAAPGEHRRRIARGHEEARRTEADLLDRLRQLPDGEAKASETAAAIARLRTYAGFREHPKLALIARLGLYKRALATEVDRLVGSGALRSADDATFLTFDELEAAIATGRAVEPDLVRARREEHRWHSTLTPPRVLTSTGETFDGHPDRSGLPEGALSGVGVSAGTVEGRARVVHRLADARLRPGDVLVTAHTDPGWTPAFVAVSGLVTEVGGVMTHGAVIAREYGLPAVVGVPGATRRIRDGQRVRVDGSSGVVEPLG